MKRFLFGLFTGVLCLLVCIALGVALLLGCDWLYRADVRLLDIPERTGLEESFILENYRAAVAYLTPWHDAPFALRGMSWTAMGTEYFRQLRVCVLCVYIAGLLGGIGLLCTRGRRIRAGRGIWHVSGTVSLGLTALLGVLLALDFTRVFAGFCGTVFGESWMLYEDVDPVVTIFPQSYFIHAAFLILFVCAAGGVLQLALGCVPTPRPAAKRADASRRKPAAAAEQKAQPSVQKQVFTVPKPAEKTVFRKTER